MLNHHLALLVVQGLPRVVQFFLVTLVLEPVLNEGLSTLCIVNYLAEVTFVSRLELEDARVKPRYIHLNLLA